METTSSGTEEEDVSYEEVEVTDSEGETESGDEGRKVEWPPKEGERIKVEEITNQNATVVTMSTKTTTSSMQQEQHYQQQHEQHQLHQQHQQQQQQLQQQQQQQQQRQQQQQQQQQSTTVTNTSSAKMSGGPKIEQNGEEEKNSDSDELARKGFQVLDHDPYGNGKELFRPGKLANRWNPSAQQLHHNGNVNGTVNGRPKVRLRNVEEILQQQEVKHSSYHIPPGTSRTRKAQENYTKHIVEAVEKNHETS